MNVYISIRRINLFYGLKIEYLEKSYFSTCMALLWESQVNSYSLRSRFHKKFLVTFFRYSFDCLRHPESSLYFLI